MKIKTDAKYMLGRMGASAHLGISLESLLTEEEFQALDQNIRTYYRPIDMQTRQQMSSQSTLAETPSKA